MPSASSHEQASWSMFVAAHRAQAPRRRVHGSQERILVFAPDPQVRVWIEHETFGEHYTVETVESIADILTCLTLVPPPWPQFLIVEVDAISREDAELLAAIRDGGWSGIAIAIGDPGKPLQRSLGIDIVLPRTLDYELLRDALKSFTRKLPLPL